MHVWGFGSLFSFELRVLKRVAEEESDRISRGFIEWMRDLRGYRSCCLSSLASTRVTSREEIQPSESAFLVASPREPTPILG
jgi:hypothetical protein